MPVIRKLDEMVVSQIAAGEVIERPASVVKELVENAIDAGARSVRVELEDGGRKLIRVSDDGCGMGEEDARLAVASHATSKIGGLDDLNKIRTMGFRGEALWSIASVCRLSILTRHADSNIGTLLTMNEAGEPQLKASARETGTTIEAHSLFYNTPARLKFMKTGRSELQAIRKLICQFALAWPEIGFTLVQGETAAVRLEPDQTHRDRIRYVYGKELDRHIIELDAELRRSHLRGFIMKPETCFPNRNYQAFVVNRRIVRDQVLSVAVATAYKGMIHGGRHPFAVLFLDVPPEEMDVNVHPTKKEVRFQNKHEIHSLIYRAIRDEFFQRMAESGDGRPPLRLATQPGPGPQEPGREQGAFDLPPSTPFRPPQQFELSRPRPESFQPEPTGYNHAPSRPESHAGLDAVGPAPYAPPFHQLKIIGQFFKTYILVEADGKPMFVDQHVAHERILYNRLKANAGRPIAQMSLLDEPVEVPHYVYPVLAENLDVVKQIGVEIEPFGERSFVIRSILHNAGSIDPVDLLIGLANEISAASYKTPENVLLDKLLTTASCKMAVKAGMELSHPEMSDLVHDLLREPYYHTCPHGRPIIFEITEQMLNKTFKRTGF